MFDFTCTSNSLVISTAGHSKAESSFGFASGWKRGFLQSSMEERFFVAVHNGRLVCKGGADHGGQDRQWTLAVVYVPLFSFSWPYTPIHVIWCLAEIFMLVNFFYSVIFSQAC